MFRTVYCRRPAGKAGRRLSPAQEWMLSLVLGAALAGAVIIAVGVHLRPVVAVLARTQTENTVKAMVEQAASGALETYTPEHEGFVRIQRDSAGVITALTTDIAALNQLRGEIVSRLLKELENLNAEPIRVPMGSLSNLDILWGRGPAMELEVVSLGTVSGEFESEFRAAGVNQTIHRIWLTVRIPLTLMLPGERMEDETHVRICIAETVIVGQVPDTYLQSSALSGVPQTGAEPP